MKNVNFLLPILFIYFICSCGRDDEPIVYPAPCVTPDIITDTTSGFLIYDKGKQENGFAKGIKINKSYESSSYLYIVDTVYTLHLKSYLFNSRGWDIESEDIIIGNIFKNVKVGCYNLIENYRSKDSIYAHYSINDSDIQHIFAKLDPSADNILEIISFEPENNRLKARLKASFISEREYLPDNPKNVRFSDVYIEHGY